MSEIATHKKNMWLTRESKTEPMKTIMENTINDDSKTSSALVVGNNLKKESMSVNEMTSEDFFRDRFAHFGVHEELLTDTVRTDTYRNAMYNNKHLFKDKIVLDVGCGIGILSLFAAKSGAARVIGVDPSNIVEYAKQIITDNNLNHVITIIKGKVEEIELPDGITKVDIIVSAWMGYCLFFDCTLDTVIYARDKWLKEGGLLFPDRANLFVVGAEDQQYKNTTINWWGDVYDFDMSAIRKAVLTKPVVDWVHASQIVTNSCFLKSVDMYSVQKGDSTFTVPFNIIALHQDDIHALVTYFTVEFTNCHTCTYFSTSPKSPKTYWKQTVFYLDEHLKVNTNDNVYGTFSITPSKHNTIDLDVVIDIRFKNDEIDLARSNVYNLSI